jgi:hypothetical protein
MRKLIASVWMTLDGVVDAESMDLKNPLTRIDKLS